MFDNKARKAERLANRIPDTLTTRGYNAAIGALIAYGFIINAIIVALTGDFFIRMNPIVFLIIYFVSAIAGIIISARSQNPLYSFIGYNLVVLPIGALLSIALVGFQGADILSAMLVTGVVVVVMTILSTIYPNIFLGMGRTLFIGLFVGLIAEIIATLLGYGGNVFNWFFVILFSLYIGYDWSKAQAYSKTLDNAIDSALDIYLDIINLFIRILELMSKSNRRR